MMIKKDLIVIGGGSAGMAAAISAYDKGVKGILILEKGPFLGGILNQCIHNGFGLQEFNEELTGPEFLTRFVRQIEERKIEYRLNTYVSDISKNKVVTFSNMTDGYVEVEAKAIVLATGCYERNAGAIGIPGDRPSGIITAGQAQLYLNEYGYMVGKRVFILGSGDIGLIMARRMSLEGAKVLGVAEIMSYSNGLNRNLVQCLQDYGIPLYLSHTVSKVVGKSHLEKVEISEVDEKLKIIPGTVTSFDVDTLLLSVGLIPYNDLLIKIGLPPSRTKGAKVNEHMETGIDGIFSCGNVLHVHDLVDNVVVEARATGAAAALFLEGKLIRHEDRITCQPGEGVGYVVPEEIDIQNADEIIPIKFRVKRPSHDVFIEYALNGKVIKRIYKATILPSEMEVDNIPKNILNINQGTVTVSLRPREVK